LRVLTLVEFVGRRQLSAEGTTLAGLYAGNPRRVTARPTAERLLEAFEDITLTTVKGPPTDRSTYDGSEPAPTAYSGAVGFFIRALYKAVHHFF
jgi:hypothetical protein